MRPINYILINDSTPAAPRGKFSDISIANLGHHYVINSQGKVLNPIDIRLPGTFLEHEVPYMEQRERKRLSQYSIGIKFNGSLKPETLNWELRALLIRLLVTLRSRFPAAKILGLSELVPETKNLKPGTRGVIRPSDAMNQIRRTLSDLP